MSGIPLFESPQDFDHLLDPISGYDGMHDLQYHAAPDASATFFRGSLISLNASGDWVTGTGGLASNRMPCWAINATADLDVTADSGNISGGTVAAYPATCGMELVTTEYDTGGTYGPNTPLVHDGGTPGFVTEGTAPILAAESVVGIVTRGVYDEVYGQSVLAFWPVFLPARA
jgi:hypothetical protein